MRHLPTTGKPYVVNDHAPDSAFVECYRWDIAREPRLLANLRRTDGSLYLPKGEQGMTSCSALYTHPFEAENDQSERSA